MTWCGWIMYSVMEERRDWGTVFTMIGEDTLAQYLHLLQLSTAIIKVRRERRGEGTEGKTEREGEGKEKENKRNNNELCM